MNAPTIDEPEPGFIGALASIYRSAKVNGIVSDLKEIRLRIIKARREGIGLPKDTYYHLPKVASDAERERTEGNQIQASTILIKKINEVLEQNKPIDATLNNRAKKTLLYGAVGLISFGMIILILRAYWKRRKDNKQLAIIAELKETKLLCKFLLHSSNSERVRLSVIRRLDTIGISDQDDLRQIEGAVGELLQRNSNTERTLGIGVAALVRTLSNRLRHRITTDTPLKKGMGS
jgi:hypothetical protein